jgi:cysteine desulfurase/selenocysteine lyase
MNIKKDFPLLVSRQSEPFIYLDNAATTHKPQMVIDALTKFYTHDYATVGRSMYTLAERATQSVEDVRKKVANFISAESEEIVFTKGATEGINLVASAWALSNLHPGQTIVLTEQEHHSNLLPWLEVAKKTGAKISYIPILKDGSLDLSNLTKIITPATKLVAITSVSNALGLKNDLKAVIKQAHKVGAKVLVDASQSVAHEKLNLKEMQPDFLLFSGHKMLGPTGVGILYISKKIIHEIPPYHVGGGMVYEADYQNATYRSGSERFEAGTPPIAQIIGLGAAVDYFNASIDFSILQAYEKKLMQQLIAGLKKIPAVTILGPIDQLEQGSILSFTVKDIHPHDLAAYLDAKGIAVRAGHYCAQPLAKKLGISGSVRVSIFGYNTPEDIEGFLKAFRELVG